MFSTLYLSFQIINTPTLSIVCTFQFFNPFGWWAFSYRRVAKFLPKNNKTYTIGSLRTVDKSIQIIAMTFLDRWTRLSGGLSICRTWARWTHHYAIFLSSLDEGEDPKSFAQFNFLFVSMRFDIKHNMNTVNKV